MDASLAPPLVHPSRGDLPVLLSIPHSGREYPSWLIAEARHGRRALATLEDPLVDRLAWRAIAAGIGAVIAQSPRGAIDCNRSVEELDPASIADAGGAPRGPRARNGLGIIASRTHQHGQLWKRPLPHERFEKRVSAIYAPYHEQIAQALGKLKARHGTALLLDLHSMPPRGAGAAQFVVGNRHGSTSAGWLAEEAMAVAARHGFRAALNDPYAGGFIVERHGRPNGGVHALQIEVDRGAYLARDLMSAGTGFDRTSRLLESLATELGSMLIPSTIGQAAE